MTEINSELSELEIIRSLSRETNIRPVMFLYSRETWVALGIIVLTLTVYLQVSGFFFVSLDDPLYVSNNPSIQVGLSWKSLRYAFTTSDDGSYLPLVWVSHAVCVSLFKHWAGGHHLVNLFFHAVNSVLFFYFFKRLSRSIWPSAAVAFLFALHPLHVESVAWVTERKDVLSTFFWILTSWAYLDYVDKPKIGRYLLMTNWFILGLLSKSMLVTLPVTLLLFDVWPLGRVHWADLSLTDKVKALWPLVREKAPLFMLSLGGAITTLFTQSGAGAMATLPLHYKLGNALLATTKYLEQMIWPVHLSAFYPFRWSAFPIWKVMGSLGFLVTVSLFCFINRRRRIYLTVGWLWYLVTILPVVGIVQVGSQAHADRYTYVPLIGIFLMLAWLAKELIERWRIPRMAVLAASAALLGTLVTLTAAQVVVWRDNLTLFKNALSLDPENALAILNIGDEFYKRDQFQDAYIVYLKGVQLAPGMHFSHIKTAQALEGMERDTEAIRYYENAKRLKPELLLPDQRIGQILVRLGRYEEAVPFVQKILRQSGAKQGLFNPLDPQASYLDWAVILASRGQLLESKSLIEVQLAKTPDASETWLAVGQAYARIGCNDEALYRMKRADQLNPGDSDVLYSLGMLLIRMKRLQEAQEVFEQMRVVNARSMKLKRGLQELEGARQPPSASEGTIHAALGAR